jgi:hypothetical protein
MTGVENAPGNGIGDYALVVIGEDEGIEGFQGRDQETKQRFLGVSRKSIAALVVNSDDLVVTSDDARLDGGDPVHIGKHTAVINSRAAQRAAKVRASFIIPHLFRSMLCPADRTKRVNARSERGEIGGHIPGAAREVPLRDKMHDWYRSFR